LICQSCHDIVEEEFFRVDKKTVKLAQFDDNVLKKIKEKKASVKKEGPKPAETKVATPVEKPVEKPAEKPVRAVDQTIIREIRTHLEKVNELLRRL
jgi:gamma-glutamyl:cysteine ligase YbdK (ATP-grasp superfamily)